jgi:glycerophosphoryl diester phosphodiesterase
MSIHFLFAVLIWTPFYASPPVQGPGYASLPVQRPIPDSSMIKKSAIWVTAHRGDWRDAPENSVQAVKDAIALGVDMVEIDLNMTRDSVVVVMHDGTIDRTTDGKGKPSDYTLAELKKFHLRNGMGRVTRNTIPTLEEVMLTAKGKVWVNLDKSFPYYREAYRVLEKTGTLGQALFKTDVPYGSAFARYGNLLDSIVFMPVIYPDRPDAKAIMEEYLDKMKPYAVELDFSSDTSAILKHPEWITEKGAKIWINSLWASLNAGHEDDMAVEDGNTKDSWDWILGEQATIIQTDRIRELLYYLKRKGLHQ